MTAEEKRQYRKTKEFQAFRLKSLEYNNYTCQLCGARHPGKKSKSLHIHHIDSSKYTQENLKNTALLCSSCHTDLVEKWIVKFQAKNKNYADNAYTRKIREIVQPFSEAQL